MDDDKFTLCLIIAFLGLLGFLSYLKSRDTGLSAMEQRVNTLVALANKDKENRGNRNVVSMSNGGRNGNERSENNHGVGPNQLHIRAGKLFGMQ